MISKEILEEAVKNSTNIFQVCNLIGLRATNNNYDKVRKYINQYNIDCSHFNLSITSNPNKIVYSDEDVFKVHDHFIATDVIKRRLLKGYKEYKCECCGISDWMGKPINLQLHHINSNRNDDRLENLQLLCPNCHSQTDNFCGHNKHSEKQKEVTREKHKKNCEWCKKEFYPKYKEQRFCCDSCKYEYNKTQLKIQVTKEQFINDLIECNYIMDRLAKKYEVSFMTIQNYCKRFNLPHKVRELKQFLTDYN